MVHSSIQLSFSSISSQCAVNWVSIEFNLSITPKYAQVEIAAAPRWVEFAKGCYFTFGWYRYWLLTHNLYSSSEVLRVIGLCSMVIVWCGFTSDAFLISASRSPLETPALPPLSPPFFAAWTPKVAKVPVKTDAINVGSSFCSGIPNAGVV